jgi:hypothetical protein
MRKSQRGEQPSEDAGDGLSLAGYQVVDPVSEVVDDGDHIAVPGDVESPHRCYQFFIGSFGCCHGALTRGQSQGTFHGAVSSAWARMPRLWAWHASRG